MEQDNKFSVAVLIPTYNAGPVWQKVLEGITVQNYPIKRKIILDSGSRDDTVRLAESAGFEVIRLPPHEFTHGGARQLLARAAGDCEICVFLTQDAIPANANTIGRLVQAFTDPSIGLAYGRQLPHDGARPLETHARLFNYPPEPATRSFEDRHRCGFKVFFCSNSFAAYRRYVLAETGGFPTGCIMGEDALFAAMMLQKGYRIAYAPDAMVKHSHHYSFKQELRRYFDTRVFHEQNRWLMAVYGRPTGEGMRFLKSQLTIVCRHHPRYLSAALTSLLAKWLGYQLGRYYRRLPPGLLRSLSMHPGYWR